MLLDESGVDQASTEAHDGERERKIDEDGSAEADGEKDHGDGDDHAGHLEAYEAAFGRAAEAHIRAWNQGG